MKHWLLWKQLKADGKQVEFASIGSSLKLCMVAEGKADVYPRFGPTMEWDTAAAHAVALYAGRSVVNAVPMDSLWCTTKKIY
jgi:3'(2'), 5'-bisphosphate nucleotidase